MGNYLLICITLIISVLLNDQVFSQDSGTAGNPRGQHCRGFNAEEIPYPTPYIGSLDRADRCKQLFSKFNTTGTVSLTFIGQNTYHNPCKIECPLCESELPDSNDNSLRSYPAHISLKDQIAQCTENESIEVFEHFMEDGVKCGPFHVCDNLCCVSHPELFPNSRKRTTTTAAPQAIPSDWTIPLTCEEDGFYRNPNDCHKFYRCHEVKGKFVKTLFSCNPSTAVFDDQFKVCVPQEDTDACDATDPGSR